MKQILSLLLASALTISVTGCAGNTETPPVPETTETAAQTTASTATQTETHTTTQTTTTRTTTNQTTTQTTTTETTSTTAETTAETMPPTEPPMTEAPQYGNTAMYGGVMVTDSGTPQARALELFSGSFKNGVRYAEALNQCKASFGEGVQVWTMVIPTSAAYYLPEEYAAQYGSQLDNTNNIAEHLSGVTLVPVYEAIGAHTEEYLYSRTDYHWQPLAAYYAAEQFAASAGVPFAALDTYQPVTREGYVGAFYAVNGISELKNAPDAFTYYKPANLDSLTCTYYDTTFSNPKQKRLFFEDNSLAASYTVYVGRDDCILQVDTGIESDRVLVIFKDSYGNALVPFLTESFSTIYLCDFRYFDVNAQSFIQQVGATDVLFAMSAVACTTSVKISQLEENVAK